MEQHCESGGAFDRCADRGAAKSDDQVFTDQASGKDAKRPELEGLIAFVREADTVIVHSMDRLARQYGISRQTLYNCLRTED